MSATTQIPWRWTREEHAERAKGWRYDFTQATEREVVDLLAALIWATKPEVVVETGTYTGVGTVAMSKALEANGRGHLWTVENDEKLNAALAKAECPRTTFVQADSLAWAIDEAPDEIGLAWVDCGDPEHRADVAEALRPKMKMGGLLACHDSAYYADDFMDLLKSRLGPSVLELDTLNGIAIWQV